MTLTCEAKGIPQPKVIWYINGIILLGESWGSMPIVSVFERGCKVQQLDLSIGNFPIGYKGWRPTPSVVFTELAAFEALSSSCREPRLMALLAAHYMALALTVFCNRSSIINLCFSRVNARNRLYSRTTTNTRSHRFVWEDGISILEFYF